MKVECEYSETGGICHVNLVDATTKELITELEKRRPCERCKYNDKVVPICDSCLWADFGHFSNNHEAKP